MVHWRQWARGLRGSSGRKKHRWFYICLPYANVKLTVFVFTQKKRAKKLPGATTLVGATITPGSLGFAEPRRVEARTPFQGATGLSQHCRPDISGPCSHLAAPLVYHWAERISYFFRVIYFLSGKLGCDRKVFSVFIFGILVYGKGRYE
jgi:hypothetical protein